MRRVFKIQIAVQNSESVTTGFLAHYLRLEIVKTILLISKNSFQISKQPSFFLKSSSVDLSMISSTAVAWRRVVEVSACRNAERFE